jgi:hypothetical protein
MIRAFEIFTVILAAIVLAPALAHIGELPGKRRLAKDDYFVVQKIYYPGFTILGISEPLAIAATGVLVFLYRNQTSKPWLAAGALAAFLLVQIIFWIFVQPVNRTWLKDHELSGAGRKLFSAGTADSRMPEQDWQKLRDRWEYSHAARAVLAFLALICLTLGLAQ